MIARAFFTVLLFAPVALAACSSDAPPVISAVDAPFIPVIETHEPAVGDDVLVFTLLDRDRQPQFPDGTEFRARFFEPTDGGVRFRADAGAVQVEEIGTESFYVASGIPLDRAGIWAVAVTASFPGGESESSPRLMFEVSARPAGPAIGDPAPDAPTPMVGDAPLGDLTGDPSPLGRMYAFSASDLIGREPFVLLFATHSRCAGRSTCQRAVSQAKRLAERIAVVHVEPFPAQRRREHQLKLDAVLAAWRVEAEPIFYVIDAAGTVAARFQIVARTADLDAAVDAVLGR